MESGNTCHYFCVNKRPCEVSVRKCTHYSTKRYIIRSQSERARREPSIRYVVVAALQLFHHRRIVFVSCFLHLSYLTVYPPSITFLHLPFDRSLYGQEVAITSLSHLRLASLVQASRPGRRRRRRRSYASLPHSLRIWLQSPGQSNLDHFQPNSQINSSTSASST